MGSRLLSRSVGGVPGRAHIRRSAVVGFCALDAPHRRGEMRVHMRASGLERPSFTVRRFFGGSNPSRYCRLSLDNPWRRENQGNNSGGRRAITVCTTLLLLIPEASRAAVVPGTSQGSGCDGAASKSCEHEVARLRGTPRARGVDPSVGCSVRRCVERQGGTLGPRGSGTRRPRRPRGSSRLTTKLASRAGASVAHRLLSEGAVAFSAPGSGRKTRCCQGARRGLPAGRLRGQPSTGSTVLGST